ncbi:uncharacterized protein LOC111430964 [Cucurbita moschata]|uniref:Uncharacterized protein LOC111430964 n=1 Tax=Cucurbita moschata TaxID=3662 RepID=A0A6J1E8W5_CUCMO|nr:uncharacterized protein LOC111430964 [Cucurbita moschata]
METATMEPTEKAATGLNCEAMDCLSERLSLQVTRAMDEQTIVKLPRVTSAMGEQTIVKLSRVCLLGRGFRTLIKNALFSSSTVVRSHNPPSFKVQRRCWHTVQCPPPLGLSVFVGTPPDLWGWIMRFHIGWRGEQNILYKGV